LGKPISKEEQEENSGIRAGRRMILDTSAIVAVLNKET
jgi:hypothetical protein